LVLPLASLQAVPLGVEHDSAEHSVPVAHSQQGEQRLPERSVCLRRWALPLQKQPVGRD
jgi:hypothetical protein